MVSTRANGPEPRTPIADTRIRILALPAAGAGGSREVPADDLRSAIAAGEVVWIDMVDPGAAASPLLGEHLRLGALTVEDCLLPLRMPKLDVLSDGTVFVAAFSIRLDTEHEPRLRATSVAMVIAPPYLVTVRREAIPELTTRLEAVLAREVELPEESGAALAHVALDALVDHHLPVMLRAAEAAEELEGRLDTGSKDESLAALEG